MLVRVPSMDPEIDPVTDYVPCNIMQQDDEEKHDNDLDDES